MPEKKLQNILIPVDFSDTSSLIIKQGARLAELTGATLHVLHVIAQSTLKHYEATHGPEAASQVSVQAQRLLNECLGKVDLGPVEVRKAIVTGDPAECVGREIEEAGIDLVILSAHDSGQKRLGRVAARVVRRARCKVLIARDWHAEPFRRIGVCVDFSDLSGAALDVGMRLARRDGASLEMIHVVYPIDRDYYAYRSDFGNKSKEAYREKVNTWLAKRIEDFTAPIKEELETIRFTTAILESVRPPDAISSHLRSNKFDLVILGTTGKESFFGLRFGSNAERLVHDTHCSALAVKPVVE